MLEPDDVAPIGQLTKTHGFKGGLLLQLSDNVRKLPATDHLLLEIDGLLVPFFIDSMDRRNHAQAVVRFDQIQSEQEAERYAQTFVFLEKEMLSENEQTRSEAHELSGYEFHDEPTGTTGTIEDVSNQNGNILFHCTVNTTEVLIPLTDDLIISADHDKRALRFNVPEGLFDLYLND